MEKNIMTGLINEMKNLGIPTEALEEKLASVTEKMEEFVTPIIEPDVYRGPTTPREARVYKAVDCTFIFYGKVKEKSMAAAVAAAVATQKTTNKSRSFLGNFMKKIGEKIEPK